LTPKEYNGWRKAYTGDKKEENENLSESGCKKMALRDEVSEPIVYCIIQLLTVYREAR
jgi:hypothetical protein